MLNKAEHDEANNTRQEDKEAAGKAGCCPKAEASLAYFLCMAFLLFSALFFTSCIVTLSILHIRLCRKARLIQLVGEEEGEETGEQEEGAGD